MKKILISSLVALSLQAATIVQMGNVYDFAEEDMLTLLQKRIEEKQALLEKNKDKIQDEMKEAIKNYRPKNLANLTPATKNRIRLIDMTYEVKEDIVVNNVLYYKKGYKINPLNYIALDRKYIVFNANNTKELEYVKNHYKDNLEYDFVLCDGDYIKASKLLERNIYYLPKLMKDRFQLEHSISIISQKDTLIQVEEINVKNVEKSENALEM